MGTAPIFSLLTLVASGQNYLHTHPAAKAIPIDPKLKAALDSTPPSPPFDQIPVTELRRQRNERIASAPKMNDKVARAGDRTIPGPHGKIPIRVYTPEGGGPFPLLLYFHGGGWVLGNIETHDDYCRSLSARGRAVVVSVDYRLAPEHKFPVPLDDCFAATQWAASNGAALGADTSRMGVAGDSAGGNLAAGVALMARDQGGPRLGLQLLLYPVTNSQAETASYHENGTGYGLTRDAMLFFWKSYLAQPADGANGYASPLRATRLASLPRTLILTAQYDPLRDDGVAYAARLSQAGVAVRCTNYLDMNHGFALWGSVYDSARRALDEVAAEVKAALR